MRMRDQEVAMAQLNMQRASATREPIIFPIHGMAYESIKLNMRHSHGHSHSHSHSHRRGGVSISLIYT
jgi:hypothetical protein